MLVDVVRWVVNLAVLSSWLGVTTRVGSFGSVVRVVSGLVSLDRELGVVRFPVE